MDHGFTPDVPKLHACLAARDISEFSLLVEDLHTELGETWGELNLDETLSFLTQPDATELQFLILAVDEDDRGKMPVLQNILQQAEKIKLPVLLFAEDLTELELYQLEQCGARHQVEYPLQEGDLAIAISKIAPNLKPVLTHKPKSGSVYAVQGIMGGAGSSTLAVNLAHELSALDKGRVCLIDLDVQFGSIAEELKLPYSDALMDLLFDVDMMDTDWLRHATQAIGHNMAVLTAPNEDVPMDFIAPDGLEKLIALAKSQFDFVVIDMPKAQTNWTGVVFDAAETVFCPLTPDARSAQMAERFRMGCISQGLPLHKVRFAMNRLDQTGGADQLQELSNSIQTDIDLVFPNGGQDVAEATRRGCSVSQVHPQNTLGQEFSKLAASLVAASEMEAALVA